MEFPEYSPVRLEGDNVFSSTAESKNGVFEEASVRLIKFSRQKLLWDSALYSCSRSQVQVISPSFCADLYMHE